MRPAKILRRAYRRAFHQPFVADLNGTEVELRMSLKAWARIIASPADDLGRAALRWLENKGARA